MPIIIITAETRTWLSIHSMQLQFYLAIGIPKESNIQSTETICIPRLSLEYRSRESGLETWISRESELLLFH